MMAMVRLVLITAEVLLGGAGSSSSRRAIILEANNNKGAETTTIEIAGTTVVGDNHQWSWPCRFIRQLISRCRLPRRYQLPAAAVGDCSRRRRRHQPAEHRRSEPISLSLSPRAKQRKPRNAPVKHQEFLLKKGYTVRSPMDDVLDDYIVIHDTGAGLCANMDISPGVQVEELQR